MKKFVFLIIVLFCTTTAAQVTLFNQANNRTSHYYQSSKWRNQAFIQLADDFEVPPNKIWTLTNVRFYGKLEDVFEEDIIRWQVAVFRNIVTNTQGLTTAYNAPRPASLFNVPATQAILTTGSDPYVTLAINNSYQLEPGIYWISVWPELDLPYTETPGDEFRNAVSAWRNRIRDTTSPGSVIRRSELAIRDVNGTLASSTFQNIWLPGSSFDAIAELAEDNFDLLFILYGNQIDTDGAFIEDIRISSSITNYPTGTINITIHIVDNVDGFKNGILYFSSPNQVSVIQSTFDSNNRISGDKFDGFYTILISMDFNQLAEQGNWFIKNITLTDDIDNVEIYTSTDRLLDFTSTIALSTPTTTGPAGSSSGDSVNTPDTNDGGGLSGGAIGGIVALISVVLLAAGCFTFIYLRNKRKEKYEFWTADMVQMLNVNPESDNNNNDVSLVVKPEDERKQESRPILSQSQHTSNSSLPPGFVSISHYQKIPLMKDEPEHIDVKIDKSLELDYSELDMEKEIGRGAFGIVYKGYWRGGLVAIKQILNQENISKKELEEFLAEAALMKRLRPHVNVVQFLGVTAPPNPLCIVTEFLNGGSLYGFLQSGKPMTVQIMKEIVTGVAAGMLHLHKEGIVHRDLAARNVLMTANFKVKISDFGMSRQTANQGANQTKTETGPLKWMAPEALMSRIYSRKTDVWAFGITLWEIVTRDEPYPDLEPVQAALAVCQTGYRMPIPPNCPPILAEVMKACVNASPEERPDFQQICNYLYDLKEEYWNPPDQPIQNSKKVDEEPEFVAPKTTTGATGYASFNDETREKENTAQGTNYGNAALSSDTNTISNSNNNNNNNNNSTTVPPQQSVPTTNYGNVTGMMSAPTVTTTTTTTTSASHYGNVPAPQPPIASNYGSVPVPQSQAVSSPSNYGNVPMPQQQQEPSQTHYGNIPQAKP